MKPHHSVSKSLKKVSFYNFKMKYIFWFSKVQFADFWYETSNIWKYITVFQNHSKKSHFITSKCNIFFWYKLAIKINGHNKLFFARRTNYISHEILWKCCITYIYNFICLFKPKCKKSKALLEIQFLVSLIFIGGLKKANGFILKGPRRPPRSGFIDNWKKTFSMNGNFHEK